MKNPFVYGGIVEGPNFADREEELSSLVRDMKDCQKIFLISPRRYGKSSLIKAVLSTLAREGFYTIYLDLYKSPSLHKLLEKYSREIATAVEGKLERAINFIKDVVPRLRPKVTLDSEGKPYIGIERVASKRETMDLLDEIYDLPQKIAVKKRKGFTVVFDEFQEITNFDGETVEKGMRACFQHHSNVGYIFAGSKRHLLSEMVQNKNRAFYKIGKAIYLDKIPRQKFRGFIEHKFKATGFKLEAGCVDRVLGLVEDYPYNAQFLCHELWDMYRDVGVIRNSDIETALKKLLVEQTPFYLSLWDSLSQHKRNVLQSIANFGGEKIFAQEFIATSGIGPVSTLQTSIKLLIKKEILDKVNGHYVFGDVFFKEWVRREIS